MRVRQRRVLGRNGLDGGGGGGGEAIIVTAQTSTDGNSIIINFDRNITGTIDILDFTIKVDGTVDNITAANMISPHILELTLATPILNTDVNITASHYGGGDTNMAIFLDYPVTNMVGISYDWVDENSNLWVDENTNNWVSQ